MKKTLTKLNQRGFSHHFLMPVIVVLAIAGIGAKAVMSNAYTTKVPTRYIATPQTEKGCWLAGRKWANNACMGKDFGTNHSCRSSSSTLKKIADTDGHARSYCTSAIALESTVSQEACVKQLHRMFVKYIGCSRRIDQENVNNARQCVGNNVPASDPLSKYKRYIADSTGADYCVAIPGPNTETGDDSITDDSQANDYMPPVAPQSMCYTITRQSGNTTEGRMFHRSGRQTYAFENSPQGIAYAADHGYRSIDLDIHITKDGVPVATHWGRPMEKEAFYDPEHRMPKSKTVEDMTFAEVSRLRHRDGQSRIHSLDYMANILKQRNLNLSFEIKTPGAARRHMSDIVATLNKYGIKAYLKGAAHMPGMNAALGTARDRGFWTRGTEGSQGWRSPTSNCR